MDGAVQAWCINIVHSQLLLLSREVLPPSEAQHCFGTSYCSISLCASVLHFIACAKCAGNITEFTEEIPDQGIAPNSSSHQLQGQPITTTLTALLFPLWKLDHHPGKNWRFIEWKTL